MVFDRDLDAFLNSFGEQGMRSLYELILRDRHDELADVVGRHQQKNQPADCFKSGIDSFEDDPDPK